MKHKVRVTGWGYVEQYIEVDAESEQKAVEKVENGELWNGGAWNCIQLDEIDFVEVVEAQ